MNTLVLGSVPYLNAKPLVSMLEDPRPADALRGPDGQVPPVRIVEAVPSRLAGVLERREVAAALVSSVIPLADASLCVLGGHAVTSDGPVRSIRLLSRVPVPKIRRLALDASSRTSVILCRVLLARVYGLWPEIVVLPPDVPAMLACADAALVIGDPALQASVAIERGEISGLAEDLDLGSLWRSVTGLPFVYAVWAAPRTGHPHSLADLLARSAAWGLDHRDGIAERQAPRRNLPVDLCVRYMTENIRYRLGPLEWEGLRRFHAEAVELGFLAERFEPLECIDPEGTLAA